MTKYGRRVTAKFYKTKKKETPLEKDGIDQMKDFKNNDFHDI